MTYHPHMPVKVKLDVVIRQSGYCGCGCGQKLGTLKETEFDHVPALCFREFDAATKTYTPDANDPTRIFAKRTECHAAKTKRDVKGNAKADRIARGGKTKSGRKMKAEALTRQSPVTWTAERRGGRDAKECQQNG